VSAKILADNLASLLLARAAHESTQASPDRPCNLAYAHTVLQRIAPRRLVFADEIATPVGAALAAIARTIKRRKLQPIGGSKPCQGQASSECRLQGMNRKVRVIAHHRRCRYWSELVEIRM
jgi:hypothetical protein